MKISLTIKIFVISAISVLSVVFLSPQLFASAPLGAQADEVVDIVSAASTQYLSSEFQPDFAFNLVGYAWQGQIAPDLEIRLFRDNTWSEWYAPESSDSVDQDGWHYSTEPVVASQASRAQYRLNGVSRISKVKLIFIGEQERHVFAVGALFDRLFSRANASSLAVSSRAAWQANESWRYNVAGAEVWPVTYQWPEKFVIHHTAGDDGGTNPAAIIRGIYYWHAVVLGWGDIGYNYIIDQQGNVYEGRYGGDGVVGAHTYRNAACAASRFGGAQREYNFNKGTIGIAILGDYENSKTLNAPVREALTTLIGTKARDFEIQPDGNSFFFDATYPNIVGHRDLDCSDCPGKNMYAELSTLRTQSAEKFVALGGQPSPIVQASYVSQSEQPVTVPSAGTKEVWVDFRNDGNITWRNYKSTTLAVAPAQPTSNFYVAAWNSATEVARLATPNVAPGETGRFIFSIKGPTNDLQLTEPFVITYGGQVVAGTSFTVSALVSGLPYAGLMSLNTIKPALFSSARQSATIQFTNRGTEVWKRGQIKLNVYDLGNRVSRFRDTNWPDQYGQFNFNEGEVQPNGVATFSLTIKSPTEVGLYRNVFHLVGTPEIIQEDQYVITRIDSTTQAALVSKTMTPAMQKGWRPAVTVFYKNTGLTTWDQSTVLKVYDIGDRVSRFRDSRWVNQYTAARLTQKSVKPGQIGTFTFYFKSPTVVGTYFNRFELVRGASVIQGSGFSLLTRVD